MAPEGAYSRAQKTSAPAAGLMVQASAMLGNGALPVGMS
jgi:hypothetical protein